MNPDGPDISIPVIPLAVYLIQRGHYDLAAMILRPVITRIIEKGPL